MDKYNDKYMCYFTFVFFYMVCAIKVEATDNTRSRKIIKA
jgi:hypothetical protein